MCFRKSTIYTYRGMKVATEDVVCYKLLSHAFGEIRSPYFNELYFRTTSTNESVTKEAKFEFLHRFKSKLGRGLHSYSVKYVAWINTDRQIHKAIIPKGTKYYYDCISNEYISEKLIVYNEIAHI